MTRELMQNTKLKERFCSAMPLIGDAAPAFTAETTKGKINFPERPQIPVFLLLKSG